MTSLLIAALAEVRGHKRSFHTQSVPELSLGSKDATLKAKSPSQYQLAGVRCPDLGPASKSLLIFFTILPCKGREATSKIATVPYFLIFVDCVQPWIIPRYKLESCAEHGNTTVSFVNWWFIRLSVPSLMGRSDSHMPFPPTFMYCLLRGKHQEGTSYWHQYYRTNLEASVFETGIKIPFLSIIYHWKLSLHSTTITYSAETQ